MEEIITLRSQAEKNYKQIKKLQRLIYLLQNNVIIYKGKNGGMYYMTKNSKIYL